MKLQILILLIINFVISGCDNSESGDTEMAISSIDYLHSVLRQPIDLEVDRRFSRAIEKCADNIEDYIPMLLYASVTKGSNGQHYLSLYCYDEDKNVLGIGVREFCNGELSLEERYPLFLGGVYGTAVRQIILKVDIRTEDQQKDETCWSIYCRSRKTLLPESDYPTIWCSIVPGTEVFIYDKDGNISEFVPLVYETIVEKNN